MKIILASASAARQTMLRNAGIEFATIASDTDEAALKAVSTAAPAELAFSLATAKAASVAAIAPKALTIGADQILVCEGKIYNKPQSVAEAAEHLAALAGRTHTLFSAVCVHQGPAQLWHHTASATLTMRPLTASEIADYLKAGGAKLLASVGAYQLEGLGANLFEHITGDIFTVLGLPLLPLLGFLRAQQVALPAARQTAGAPAL
jgi:septum formation protein